MISVDKFMQQMFDMFSSEQEIQKKLEKDIFQFFVIFSRFEFALKSSGFLQKQKKNAEPDWNSFVKKYKDTFQVTEALSPSFSYLTEQKSAPNRQMLKVSNGALSTTWEKQNINVKDPELKKVTDSIKLVRNNLFHGGKYGDKSWNEPKRTSILINHSIKVILALVELDQEIKISFENFT
ncbi:hypothetical protein ACRTC3_20820 [Photobacterium damselae]|uniref:hypothetical protein n=1 Tax=Photobacterium damselae TaxID=38293 RepID=UPI003D7ED3A6